MPTYSIITARFLLTLGALCLALETNAGTAFYISPNGSDSFDGRSPNRPWHNFRMVFGNVPLLQPGDTLVLMDGVYTDSTTGLPNLWCGAGGNANSGTPTAPITIMAQHERKAFLKGDGTWMTFQMSNCSYYNIVGLHAEGGDNNTTHVMGQGGSVMSAGNCRHIAFRRLLVARPNRYDNTHLLLLDHTDSSLVEESEFYYFHRHAMINWWSSNNIFRRCYCNSRMWGDIPGGVVSHTPDRGDGCTTHYPGQFNIVENVISEGNEYVLGEAAFDTTGTGKYILRENKLLGSISINDWVGVGSGPNRSWKPTYGDPPYVIPKSDLMPQDNLIQDVVVIAPRDYGIVLDAVKEHYLRGVSILEDGIPRENPRDGLNAGYLQLGSPPSYVGDSLPSIAASNILVTGNATTGIHMAIANWSIDRANAFGNHPEFDPAMSDGRYHNPTAIDPQLGTCKAWIPDASPMKGTGAAGGDVGATILYRYENGVLTQQALWDCSTGEFPHGAIVPGLNDVPDSSLFDIQHRLNINANGCLFPAGYCSGTSVESRHPLDRNAMDVYPNPNHGAFTVRAGADRFMIVMTNVLGERVFSRCYEGDDVTIDPGELPRGVYFLCATPTHGAELRQFIVVTK